MKQPVIPYRITRRDDGLLLEWEAAGHAALFEARRLRLSCPCAECVEEMSGRPILDAGAVPEDVRALALRLVGAYALHVSWSDGHTSGIYPWDRLLAGCPCDTCAARRGDPTTH